MCFVLSDCRKRPLQRAIACGFHLRQDFNVAKWWASGKQFVLVFCIELHTCRFVQFCITGA